MKKVMALLIVVGLSFLLIGCSKETTDSDNSNDRNNGTVLVERDADDIIDEISNEIKAAFDN